MSMIFGDWRQLHRRERRATRDGQLRSLLFSCFAYFHPSMRRQKKNPLHGAMFHVGLGMDGVSCGTRVV